MTMSSIAGGKRETVADVLASANTTADQTVFADLAVREHDTASVECRFVFCKVPGPWCIRLLIV